MIDRIQISFGTRVCSALLFGLMVLFTPCTSGVSAQDVQLATLGDQVLTLPKLSGGAPAPMRLVALKSPEYKDTDVFHTIYLPESWSADGPAIPIIFEYTGNYSPASGSTGQVEHAALGYGLSGGQYIWCSLPCVNKSNDANELTWWGDEKATVEYAKRNVPRIIKQFHADDTAVFLCGFSRGAIAVNYIGLYDDEIARLWSAFITHDHFDGVKSWRTEWGTPLSRYQSSARIRLGRVGQRPYWVSQHGSVDDIKQFVRNCVADTSNFTFRAVNVTEILGKLPGATAKTTHTDRWPLVPSPSRDLVRSWMDSVANDACSEPSQ